MSDHPNRQAMTAATIAAGIAFLVMLSAIIYGLLRGDLSEFSAIAAMPWGMGTFIDLSIGLMLFAGWVNYREKSLLRGLLWTALFFSTGNLGTSLYVFLALLRSQSWREFWLGRRAAD